MRYEMALPNEGSATLLLTGEELTAEDVEDVFAWLEVMKRTIQRSVNRPASRIPDTPGGEREED